MVNQIRTHGLVHNYHETIVCRVCSRLIFWSWVAVLRKWRHTNHTQYIFLDSLWWKEAKSITFMEYNLLYQKLCKKNTNFMENYEVFSISQQPNGSFSFQAYVLVGNRPIVFTKFCHWLWDQYLNFYLRRTQFLSIKNKENNENDQVRQQINKNAQDTCLYVVLCMIELYCKDLCQCGTVLCST